MKLLKDSQTLNTVFPPFKKCPFSSCPDPGGCTVPGHAVTLQLFVFVFVQVTILNSLFSGASEICAGAEAAAGCALEACGGVCDGARPNSRGHER